MSRALARLSLSLNVRSRSRSPPRDDDGQQVPLTPDTTNSSSRSPKRRLSLSRSWTKDNTAARNSRPASPVFDSDEATPGKQKSAANHAIAIDTAKANGVTLSLPSLLSPPNPAFTLTESRGILLNAHRPMSHQRSKSDQGNTRQDNAVSETKQADPVSTADAARDTSATGTGTSEGAAPSLSPYQKSYLALSRPQFRSAQSADSLDRQIPTVANSPRPKIRFAPLPDPRPRRYSTGRDILTDRDGNQVHVYAADGRSADVGSWSTDGSLTMAGTSGGDSLLKAPSTPGNLPFLAVSPASDGVGEAMSPATSVGQWSTHAMSAPTSPVTKTGGMSFASKLFRRKKSSSVSSRDGFTLSEDSPTTGSGLFGGFGLSKSLSASGSDSGSRRTGIPLRKVKTDDSVSSVNSRRKIVYPSVAQRSSSSRFTPAIEASRNDEPEFVEWGNYTSRGSLGSRPSSIDEDDGSGMAWVRKRRQERERLAAEQQTDKEREETATTAHSVKNDKPLLATAMSSDIESGPRDDFPTRDILTDDRAPVAIENAHSDAASADGTDDPDSPLSASTSVTEEDDETGEAMTAADLEEEERLTEEARKTTNSAAHEKFHTHEKVARTRQLEAGSTPSSFHNLSYSRSQSLRSELPLYKPLGR